MMPNSLNYYGLLGPKGNNFGQVLYFCQDCQMSRVNYYYIEFFLAEDGNTDVNFDAIIESGSS